MREELEQIVREALGKVAASIGEPTLATLEPGVERARDPAHGDFASNVALRAKLQGRPPRDVAQALADAIETGPLVESIEIAGPGFINFRLTAEAYYESLRSILRDGNAFGRSPAGSRGRALVEYVSANPTGPLHVGHGRIAAYGASLAAILEAAGYAVDEEYYVNDAGRQMDILATSVWLRYANRLGAVGAFPDNCYQGDYVVGIAERLQAEHGDSYLGNPAPAIAALEAAGDDAEKNLDRLIAALKSELGDERFSAVLDAALDEILADIRDDLAEFGVHPDRWFSERSLIASGAVDRALDRLQEAGHLYERSGPLWFRTTAYGDDKDRVVRRESGATTYFASDIAYHNEKFARGYDFLINVFGSDHHGYVGRMQAAVAAAGYEPERLEFRLIQFVVLFRGDEKVQMTTRGGRYVTLRELRREVGNDAARFLYVSRSNDQHLEFDLELAKAQTNDNPVYYVQYAHARVASVLGRLDGALPDVAGVDFDRLSKPAEMTLLRLLSRYSEIVDLAANARGPQHLVHYLRELAAAFHTFYNAHRVLTDDAATRDARVLLAVATQQVVRNGLGLLGVSAPETM